MTKLERRIRDAYTKTRSYHEMLLLVWPPDEYPKAHRISNNGGPPGCAMAFGARLAKMGGSRSAAPGGCTVYLPPLSDRENLQAAAKSAFAGMPWRGSNEPPNHRR